jgi:hypothetical protein
VTGFLHRRQQGLITGFLDNAGMKIPKGFAMGLMSGCDVLVKNRGTNEAVPGMKAYANFADGGVTFAATATPSGATATSWSIAAETTTFTGAISGNILTATAVTGTLYPGAVLTGGTVATGTAVGIQLTSTAALGALGGAGTYEVSIPEQTVVAAALTASYGLLTLTTVTSGTFGVGDTLTDASSTAATTGTYITALITGTGGSGSTAAVNYSQAISSGAGEGNLTAALNVETKWIARSSGLAGELVKISDHPQG